MLNNQEMLEKLAGVIKESQSLLNSYPNHLPFKILMDQLYFIRDYYEGKSNDKRKLKAVDLDYIIAREVGDINQDLAEKLCVIYDSVLLMRGENLTAWKSPHHKNRNF